MTSIKRNIRLLVFVVFASFLSSCGPTALKETLEASSVRYDASGTPHCVGQVRNISRQAINNLEVQIEFQNIDGNRVRTGAESSSPKSLTPGTSGSFSVPYLKGPNDPPVVKCKIVEFSSSDGEPLLHTDKSGPSGGS